jgi:radical SAM protein with 4Fe4S-binding SPASM domain
MGDTVTHTTSCLAPSFLPATAVLEMTYRCNHACLFCSCPWFAPRGDYDVRPELTIEDWKHLIGTLCEMGCFNLAFTGGEPLLKEGIEEIIKYAAGCKVSRIETEGGRLVARDVPPKLYLLSNGKNMSRRVIDLCSKHDIHLSMSLPGLSTFAAHNQAGTEPDTILKWFRVAQEANVGTTVGITVTRRNIHELYETIAEALLAGASTLLMNRFLPGGRGLLHNDELSLGKDNITTMLDTAESVLQTANRTGSVGTELPLCLIDKERYTHLKVGTRCSAAKGFFVIDPSGYARVCNHSPVRLNHYTELERLKMHPYWRTFVFREYLPGECSGCDLTDQCDGGCREAAHITGGKIDAVDPALPEMRCITKYATNRLLESTFKGRTLFVT